MSLLLSNAVLNAEIPKFTVTAYAIYVMALRFNATYVETVDTALVGMANLIIICLQILESVKYAYPCKVRKI